MNRETETLERDVLDGAVKLLNTLCWHDSVLYEIRLIRTKSADQVVLILDLIDDWEQNIFRHAEIVFQNCRLVRSQMNWGVDCISEGEMIEGATSTESGTLIDEAKSVWQGTDINTDGLAEFHLVLNSTGSTLDIVFGAVAITLSQRKKFE